MTQDKWTQQLREKLDLHQEKAPDDLWAQIEGAQPVTPQAPQRRGLAAVRRWAVAASLLVAVGGIAVWWAATAERSSEREMLAADGKVQTTDAEMLASNEEMLTLDENAQTADEQIQTFDGETMTSEELTRTSLEQTQTSDEQTQTSVEQTQTSVEQTQTSDGEMKASEEQTQTSEGQTQTQPIRELPQPEQPRHEHHIKRSIRGGKAFALKLYAQGRFGSTDNVNGVMMSSHMAQQYHYISSMSSARQTPPIYLSGYKEEETHRHPVTLGLTTDIALGSRWGLSTGITYTLLQSDFTQHMGSQRIDRRQRLHYVGVPVMLSYRLWSHRRLSLYATAGAQADWNVASSMESQGVSLQVPKDRVQWSCAAAAGLQYDVLPWLSAYAEPGVRHYFDNGSIINNYFKDKPDCFSLHLGLRLRLQQ